MREREPRIDSDGVTVVREGGRFVLARRDRQTFQWVSRFVGGVRPSELDVLDADDALFAYYTYQMLRRVTMLEYVWCNDAEELVVVRPFSETFDWQEPAVELRDGMLDRFAYTEQDAGTFALCAPDVACRVRLKHPRIAQLLFSLTSPRSQRSTSEEDALRSILAGAGFMTAEGMESESRRTWEFPDALFHFRSRLVGNLPRRGATFRFAAQSRNAPARKPAMSSAPIALSKPKMDAKARGLAWAMETRRSSRDFMGEPLSLDRLAELLYRVARIVEFKPAGEAPQSYETIKRPVPGGGGMGEIEFYACVDRCTGIDRGLYHYDAFAHALEPVERARDYVERFMARAGACYGKPEAPPQVLLMLSSRMPRRAWKYEGTAYRTTLLDAGCAIYALCLVATDLGLSACPLGAGDVTLFARATGLDAYEETSVAEFALGTPTATR